MFKFLACLEMPVNMTQYQGAVVILTNHNFVFRPNFTNFIRPQVFQYHSLTFPTKFSEIFKIISIVSQFCNCSSFTKVLFLYTYKKDLHINAGYYGCFTILAHQCWLLQLLYYSIIRGLSAIYICAAKLTQDPNKTLQKIFYLPPKP